MKVKKILAGLSAAAMAASMLSMVSFAEGDDVETGAVLTPIFGVQAYAQDNVNWGWTAVPGEFDENNTAIFEVDCAQLAAEAKEKGGEDSGVAGAGIQLFVDNGYNFADGVTATGHVSVNARIGGGVTTLFDDEATLKKVTQSWGVEFNKNWTLPASDWDTLAALGTVTVEVKIDDPSEWTLTYPDIPEPEPIDSEYDVAIPVISTEYKGDWQGDGLTDGLDLSMIKKADGLKITVDYSVVDSQQHADAQAEYDAAETDEEREAAQKKLDASSQHVFAPMDQHNWTKLGDKYNFNQDGWTIDPSIVRATTAKDTSDEFKAEKEAAGDAPFMKMDGFIMVEEDGQLVFELNEGMVGELLEKAYAEESPWFGLGAQVYGVVLDKVVYEFNVDGETFEINEGITYGTPVEFDPTDDVDPDKGYNSASFKLTGISLEDKGLEEGADTDSWNDWCQYKIKITDNDGNVGYVGVLGAQGNWDFTVDDNGTPDDKEDDIVIPADYVLKTDAAGNVDVILPYEWGYTYEVIGTGWEQYPDDPYALLQTVTLYNAQSVPEWPTYPSGDDSQPDDSQPEDSQPEDSQPEDSQPEDSQPEDSQPEDSQPADDDSNKGTQPTDGTNPVSTDSATSSVPSTDSATSSKPDDSKSAGTGAAALGFGALTLAGAAVVITKKKF